MAIHHKLVYIINAISIKIQASIFAKIDKILLKFIRKHKGPRQPKLVLKISTDWRHYFT